MLASMLIPAAFPRRGSSDPHSRPGWFNRRITAVLQTLSWSAYSHPIHTMVLIALVASTTYLTLLDESLIRSFAQRSLVGKPDFNFLSASSKTLFASSDSNWEWAMSERTSDPSTSILTLIFPNTAKNLLPNSSAFTIHSSALVLSTSPETALTPHGSAVTVSIPFSQAAAYLDSIQQLSPAAADGKLVSEKWIMENARSGLGFSGNIVQSVESVWYSFLNVLMEAETIDVLIMALGYIAMYVTFVSLFISMRQMGSKFWLAGSVIFSSLFAFFFGVVVTTRIGVPVNLVLLSEGLPFLVVVIGFDKPIKLTKAVLLASRETRRGDSTIAPSPISETAPQTPVDGTGKYFEGDSSSGTIASSRPSKSDPRRPIAIPKAMQAGVKECGFQIVCEYALEIGLLIIGALSGVQGGLRQFCILAAWVLAFDCILLFTFYISILFVKLEINRIKRHIAYSRALEDDGLAKHIAERVASNEDKLYETLEASQSSSPKKASSSRSVFGKHIRDITVPKFKALMVGGFLLVNVLNMATIPFISGTSRGITNSFFPARDNMTLAVLSGEFDPIAIAGTSLDSILSQTKLNYEQFGAPNSAIVAVMPPIIYQSLPIGSSLGISPDVIPLPGSKVVGSILKSLEDPVLSKWIVVALALSLAFNGYLFNAARWSLKEGPEPSNPPPKANEMLEGNPNVADEVFGLGTTASARTGTNTPLTSVSSSRDLYSLTTPSAAARQRLPVFYDNNSDAISKLPRRSAQDCLALIKDKRAPEVADEDLIALTLTGDIPSYSLEKILVDKTRAVKIRRSVVSRTNAVSDTFGGTLLEHSKLPYEGFNYDNVYGACCENVIGYMPLPVGVAGPVLVDGRNYFLPMATTEGVLVASTSRGCKAMNLGGGVTTILTDEGMTRGPCVSFGTLARAGAAKLWLDSPVGQEVMKEAFNSTTRFGRLLSLKTAIAGTYLYIRFKAITGDAMGMNMISKGVEKALRKMSDQFEDMEIISISGNYCADKKSAAVNWIEGRGKGVVAEAILSEKIVRDVLKSTIDALVELNTAKNLIGSAMAGSLGGFNAHAANIVTAIYLATGQDPAQNVESSSCITIMRKVKGNLHISVSMPSIEVGTIGGGTILEPQKAMLDILGVQGSHPITPGDNARRLARIIAAGVLAGELSLCAALAAGHLVQAHMAHNRSNVNSVVPTRVTTPGPSTKDP